MKFDRRTVILGAAGAAGVAGVGAFGVYRFSDPVSYARAYLTELVGPFRVEQSDLVKMVDAAMPRARERKLRKLAFLSPAQGHLPASWDLELDDFQRMLLTQLVIYTDYLSVKDSGKNPLVTYLGELPCNNPFKRV